MARRYVTLSQDLIEFADSAADYLEEEGYRVSVELASLHYPNTPTLVGKRGATEYIVEVASIAVSSNFVNWSHYGRARGKETFVALVLPEACNVSTDELAKLRVRGIGMCSATATALSVVLEPVDLSMTVGIPDLKSEKLKVQKILKPPFKKIADGSIVDGFKDAAAAFEDEARTHLKNGVATGRLVFVTPAGNPKVLTAKKISKLTLGQLGEAYSEIVAPTQADELARRAISSILKDRNDATHASRKPVILRRIKKNTPLHAQAILNAVRALT